MGSGLGVRGTFQETQRAEPFGAGLLSKADYK